MKKVTIAVLGFLFAISFVACKKTDVPGNANLEASKTSSIQKSEPVLFTLSQVAAGSSVNWKVSPSANTLISANGNQASIKFAQKGNYTVTAVSGSITASSSITVLDSVYTGGQNQTPATILPFSAGEVIKITASRIDSGSTSGLLFSVITTNSYTCLSNSLKSSFTSGANNYGINFTGVSVPGGCTTGTAKAGSFIDLYPIASGTNTLTINFKGTNYTGTIVKTGNNYTINWAYTTGVTIIPNSL